MATQFELFVNQEMPKRVYTNQFPLTAGHVPVATGVGLEVEARTLSASDISDISSYATQGDLSNVLADANEYADGLVVGLWDDRGAYAVNAAGNIDYPSSAGSGVAGALMKGDIFTVAGAVTGVSTVNNIAVNNGDTVRALVDNPSATDNAHWVIAENNIGYVPENTANKTTDTDLSGAAGTYPDTPTVKSYIDNYDISAAAINSTGTVTLTRTESDLTFQVPTAISGLSFDANTGVLTSSYTNNAVDTTITVAANEVSDNVFRIKDDTDATKKIAFQASGIGTGQTKTISMPNFDVYLTPIRRRIQTSGSGLENLLLNNTETYIEITGGTTIIIPVYPPYTVNAGASGYLFNATNVAKTIRFQHTWSGEISSFVGTCSHFFPETNETGSYTSTVPGSSGNTYTDIQLLPGETLRFVVSGTKTLFTVNIYRNSSNVMYENTFKIKRSALESYGVRFETSAVTTDRVITMPNFDVNLGSIPATKVYTASVSYSAGELVYHQNETWRVLVAHTGTIPFVNGNLELVGDALNVALYGTYLHVAQRLGVLDPITNIVNKTLIVTISVSSDSTINISEAPYRVIILNRYPSFPKKVTITKTHATNIVRFFDDTHANITTTTTGTTATYDIILAPGGEVELLNNDYEVMVLLRKQNTIGRFKLSDASSTLSAYQNRGWLFNGSATDARTVTLPDANVNLGTMSSVATTDSNTLSGTRNRIVGGSNNDVSGTDNIAIGCKLTTLNGIGQIVLGATASARLKCNDITVLGSVQDKCTNVKHFLYKGLLASCYLSNAAGQANGTTPDTTNCPRATLSSAEGVSLFELRFVSNGWDFTPTFIGSISGCRVFSVHSNGVGGYTVSAVATPYADMATGGLGITFAITVITAVGGEKLLQIIPTVSGLGGSGLSNNHATLDAIYQF